VAEDIAAPEMTKPVRQRKATKAEAPAGGVRELAEVVAEIKRLKEEGLTVPVIAQRLELSYALVNQVMLQSYKMSVDTTALFERLERKRLGLDAD
jgi:predicted amino acid racemase